MDTQPAFGFNELFSCIVGDMAKAIAERNGESKQQQFTRSQAAVAMILGLWPRDVIEAMLAGHCVMFHEVMVDDVRDTLRGETDTMRRRTRGGLVAMNKAFTSNLDLLERYQRRPSEGIREGSAARPAEAGARPPETETVSRGAPVSRAAAVSRGVPASGMAAPHDGAMKVDATAPDKGPTDSPAAASDTDAPGLVAPEVGTAAPRMTPAAAEFIAEIATGSGGPSDRALAAFHANPEAEAALLAGDPLRFAHAMGIEPSDAFLAAAAEPGSPFDVRTAGARRVESGAVSSKV